MESLQQWLLTQGFHPDYGVHYLTERPELDPFERVYTALRKQEGRLLDDDTVKKLPGFPAGDLFNEWKSRENSALRLVKHLRKQSAGMPVRILEVGCGNGWLSRMLSQVPNSEVMALDVNAEELIQGARVFYETHPNVFFVYADLFTAPLPAGSFDFIVLAASVQYFPSLTHLIARLRNLLTESGEIHIIDSPFYTHNQIPGAKARTENYYDGQNFREMMAYYHHHSIEEAMELGGKWKDNPHNVIKKAFRWWFRPWHSPFGWMQF